MERAAVYLKLRRGMPRAWGAIDTPAGTLHAKDIEVGLGLTSVEGRAVYVDMRDDASFENPTPRRIARYRLTEKGELWAEQLLAEQAAGTKPWVRDWE